MATDKNDKPIRKGDEIVLRMTIIDIAEPEPHPVLGEPHADATTVVTAVLDPNDPNSPRFVFRADHIERA